MWNKNNALNKAFSLLTNTDKFKVIFITVTQIILSLLDLLGVAFFAVLGSLAVTGSSSRPNGDRVNKFLQLLRIDALPIQKQAAFIGLAAAFLLVSKTLLSLYFTRKTMYFLSFRSAQITRNLISKLLSQPLQLIQKRSMQENIYALTGGVGNMMNQIIGSAMVMISDLALVLIMFIGLFYLDPIMSILTLLIFGGVAIFLYYLLHKTANELGKKRSKLIIKSTEMIQEILLTYRESVVGSKRGYYVNKIGEQQFELASNLAKTTFLPNISKYVLEITVITGTVLVSGLQFIRQDAAHSVAILTAFLAASTRIAPAILRIQQNAIQIKSVAGLAEPSVRLINEIDHLDLPTEKQNRFSIEHGNAWGPIEVSNLSFKYENSSSLILNNIRLIIPFGTIVSFVGKSGVGKTTLADLILGINQPTAGKVTISGKDPVEISKQYPGALAYVPQETVLINGTIRENLCMGYNEKEISTECINSALEKTNMLEYVTSLENGVDTYIGDKGYRLSGGQKQRIGLARALLTQPKILVMDEATSALDSETEKSITESILKLRGQTTVILIAHRMRTVMSSDSIIYLEDGTIKAQGIFNEVRSKVPNFELAATEIGL